MGEIDSLQASSALITTHMIAATFYAAPCSCPGFLLELDWLVCASSFFGHAGGYFGPTTQCLTYLRYATSRSPKTLKKPKKILRGFPTGPPYGASLRGLPTGPPYGAKKQNPAGLLGGRLRRRAYRPASGYDPYASGIFA